MLSYRYRYSSTRVRPRVGTRVNGRVYSNTSTAILEYSRVRRCEARLAANRGLKPENRTKKSSHSFSRVLNCSWRKLISNVSAWEFRRKKLGFRVRFSHIFSMHEIPNSPFPTGASCIAKVRTRRNSSTRLSTLVL